MKKNQYKCKVCGVSDPALFHASKHQLCKDHYYEYLKSLKNKKVPEPSTPDDNDEKVSMSQLRQLEKVIEEMGIHFQKQIDELQKEIIELKEQAQSKPAPIVPSLPPVPSRRNDKVLPLPKPTNSKRSRSPSPKILPLPKIEVSEKSENEKMAEMIESIKKGYYSLPAMNKILSDNGIKVVLPKTMKKSAAVDKTIALLNDLIESDIE